MEPSHALPRIYQLRVVLRGISPLIWRRLLVDSDTTLAQLHDILQLVFDWSGENLHEFHIYGRDYGSNGADTQSVRLSDFRLHSGERFRYVYDFGAYWQCDVRLGPGHMTVDTCGKPYLLTLFEAVSYCYIGAYALITSSLAFQGPSSTMKDASRLCPAPRVPLAAGSIQGP